MVCGLKEWIVLPDRTAIQSVCATNGPSSHWDSIRQLEIRRFLADGRQPGNDAVSTWETLGLYRMRVPAEGRTGSRVVRASGKVVWTWPSVVAADAGAMQIQLGKERGLRGVEAALRSMALRTATARAAWSQKSVAKLVVAEA